MLSVLWRHSMTCVVWCVCAQHTHTTPHRSYYDAIALTTSARRLYQHWTNSCNFSWALAVAPWWWFLCKPKHVAAASVILISFNQLYVFTLCISWIIKWLILLNIILPSMPRSSVLSFTSGFPTKTSVFILLVPTHLIADLVTWIMSNEDRTPAVVTVSGYDSVHSLRNKINHVITRSNCSVVSEPARNTYVCHVVRCRVVLSACSAVCVCQTNTSGCVHLTALCTQYLRAVMTSLWPH